jgi:hypothetical protein
MKDDEEAKDCTDKICDASNIPNNFVLAARTKIVNCFALCKNRLLVHSVRHNFFSRVNPALGIFKFIVNTG